MENLLKEIEDFRQNFIKTKELLDIPGQKSDYREKSRLMSKPGFWDNREEAVKISQEVEGLESEIKNWDSMEKEIKDLEKLVALANKEEDNSIFKQAREKLENLKTKFSDLEFKLLFEGKYDKRNAIISIHAGTGGVDAQDWAQMLLRMFMRFCENKGWKMEVLEENYAQEAGIKSASFRVQAPYAYGYLKSENGVHRLVRISPFDAEGMRHTSFAKVEVLPEFEVTDTVELKEEDLRIDFFRSSGPGGQSVNTTDSAVRIVHVPTGLSAASQTQRSQHQNKETALNILKSKIQQLEEDKKQEKEEALKDKVTQAQWGKHIRSYVLNPYKMVKDHRTNYSTQEVEKVLDGELGEFMESYLRYKAQR